MKAYLDIVKNVLENGKMKHNRTGIDTLTIAGAMFQHDMKDGFPLLTTKFVPFRLVSSELEFFIKGITDKKWLQDRNNHIWDEWCSPEKVPYAHDEETKLRMKNERELGQIYGFMWRNFGKQYVSYDQEPIGDGVDQLKQLVNTLKTNPNDRRMIVSAWNPVGIPKMALPPCHYGFQIVVIEDEINLLWNQRSVDLLLGCPFNAASYGTLLHLLALESGLKPGKLIGFFADVHIYANHIEGAKEQLKREPKQLPKIVTNNFTDIFSWQYTDSVIEGYEYHPKIKFDIAV